MKIAKTGLYKVTSNQAVLKKEDMDKMKRSGASVLAGDAEEPKPAKKGRKRPHKMSIEELHDGSFGITHQHKTSPDEKPMEDEKFSARNSKHLIRHVRQTYSDQGMPSYAEGTDFVPETGPALLHRGEQVIPAKTKPDFGGPKPGEYTPSGSVLKSPDIYIGGKTAKKSTVMSDKKKITGLRNSLGTSDDEARKPQRAQNVT